MKKSELKEMIRQAMLGEEMDVPMDIETDIPVDKLDFYARVMIKANLRGLGVDLKDPMSTNNKDYINETYKLQLPEHENYETLGGLIVHLTEEIPDQNQNITIDQFEFTIEQVSNTKIELISLKINPEHYP